VLRIVLSELQSRMEFARKVLVSKYTTKGRATSTGFPLNRKCG
jgi:hypothetical protein